ncbi:MAG: hypothetical protein FWG48_01870 [Oscillospiraceae bacterium]|nr:hypothetical protein [Oscillospiraceae bacterium]
MKKLPPRAIHLLAALIAGFIISAAVTKLTGFSIFGAAREKPLSAKEASNEKLTALAFETLEVIKAGDYRALSKIAHPEEGVVFSPCATVNPGTNKCFLPDMIAAFGKDKNAYVWGVAAAGGEPIEMTAPEYFSMFVFDRDYTAASVVGINRVVRSGNALENIREVFPDVLFVDFFYPGGERDPADEQDWSSLRLGYEEYGGALKLRVILRSDWN